MSDISRIDYVISGVQKELSRQNSLWGDRSKNHPFEWMSILGEEFGELCEAVNETYFAKARHPERGGYDNIFKEAIQIAAVAMQIAAVADYQEELLMKGKL